MKTSEFEISLRIRHPDMDPDMITKALGLTPETTHRFNENRTTPKGLKLDGVYKETYWCKKFDNKDDVGLSELISLANMKIENSSAFLKQIIEDGGEIEYFIGCFVGANVGEVLTWKLLSQCAELNINLAFDIYNYETKDSENLES